MEVHQVLDVAAAAGVLDCALGLRAADEGPLQFITPQDYAANPGLAVSIQTLNDPNTIHRPAPDNYSQVESLMTAAFFKAVEGQQPVDAALTGLQQEANKVLSGKSGF
jgi:hypothetical protein